MKIEGRRFSVPHCIFQEPMHAKVMLLLVYLLSRSDIHGCCRPGYDDMRLALRGDEDERGSKTTVSDGLKHLRKTGWILHTRRTNHAMIIWLQVPARFRKLARGGADEHLLSVVQ